MSIIDDPDLEVVDNGWWLDLVFLGIPRCGLWVWDGAGSSARLCVEELNVG